MIVISQYTKKKIQKFFVQNLYNHIKTKISGWKKLHIQFMHKIHATNTCTEFTIPVMKPKKMWIRNLAAE